MFNFAFLLEGEATTGGGNMLFTFLPIILIVVVLFFFSSRQKKKDREEAAARDALQVGDEVTTIGGIIGKVVSIKGETFVLETTKDKTKIRFLKGAIRSIDVKVADLAAQVMESKQETKVNGEAVNEEPVKRSIFGRKKTKQDAPVEAPQIVEPTEEENK